MIRRCATLLLLLAVLAAPAVVAAPPPKLGAEVYGRLPNIELMQLSPAGERLAYIQVNGDERRLVIKDLAGKVLLASGVGDKKVRDLEWAGEDHLIVEISTTGRLGDAWYREEWIRSLVVRLDAAKAFQVFFPGDSMIAATFGAYGASQQDGKWYGYFGGIPYHKTRGFDPTLNEVNYRNLYRVNLDTGLWDLVASGQQRPHDWALDAKGGVVAQTEYEPTTGAFHLRRSNDGGAVVSSSIEPLEERQLRGLGRTPGTVVVDAPIPEEFDVASGAHKALVDDGLIESYIHDPATRRLLGVWIAGDRPEQRFFDPVMTSTQARFAKALGGRPTLASWSTDLSKMVVFTDGDGDAGTYWLSDGKTVKPYGYAYPELPDANVGARRMITYKAADGLELKGVLTLPPGREAKGLPLVVMPHGGPEAHDDLQFDWLSEAFAGRGYAVFQPNFRGSDGEGGKPLRDAGFGEWGRKMQTDVSDGVAALARRGLVDPKRACIVGASYGGYVALAGVTVQQGLYRCAVSYGGLSDLGDFLERITPSWSDPRNPETRYLRRFIGVRDSEDPALRALSPARLADRADAPVLLIHGADDTVVPILQSRKMERELTKAGKPVEFVLLKGEDHWLSRDATRKAMLAAALAFVEKYDPAD